jgi:hypothetical protein
MHVYLHEAPSKALRYFKLAAAKPGSYRGDSFFALGSIYLKMKGNAFRAINYFEVSAAEDCEAGSMFLLQLKTAVESPDFAIVADGENKVYDEAVKLAEEGNYKKAASTLKPLLAAPSWKSKALYALGVVLLSEEKRVLGMKRMEQACQLNCPKATLFLNTIQQYV